METEEDQGTNKSLFSTESKRYPQNKEEDDERYVCKKCKDTGKILTKSGMHTCYDCLVAGRLNVHSKDVKETNIKW